VSHFPALIGGVAAAFAAHGITGRVDTDAMAIGFLLGFFGVEFAKWALVRGLMGSSAGFWQTSVGRWVIGRMAGGAVYTALTAALWKPACYAVAYSAVGLVYVVGWQPVAAVVLALPWLIWGLALAGAWYLRTSAKVVIGKLSAPLRRFYRSLRMGGGGSAGFAGICEEWANRYRPGMIFLGHSLFDRRWPVGMRDDRMVQTLAGTGGGKGESAIISNVLLKDSGSLFCVDFKGQIAAVTAEALRRKGYTVHVIDHLNVLKQGTACVDPLNDLNPEALDYVERVKKIVEAMTIPTGERNRFFEEGGKTICAGAIDYLMRREGDEFVPPEDLEAEENTNE
jgi:type IV secretory pathway TraG/TraD family ATPase VirD4